MAVCYREWEWLGGRLYFGIYMGTTDTICARGEGTLIYRRNEAIFQ